MKTKSLIQDKDSEQTLKKQGYRLVGKHSMVKVCEWCKRAISGCGECYKNKFYGIPSWRCLQMTPWLECKNSCQHCWRPIELDMKELMKTKRVEKPKEIIENCIKMQNLLLTGFGGKEKFDKKRFVESHIPSHFAISLLGEPTLYPYIGELVAELRKQGKTSFIVSNGLHPEILKRLEKKNQLPTQFYVSLNASNEKEYNLWHKSKMKSAWKKYNETLKLLKSITEKGKRTVLRMTLVRDLNMSEKHIKEFAELIRKASPRWVEVKGFISIGYARARLPYEAMPTFEELKVFAKKLAKAIKYKLVDYHRPSKVFLLEKDHAINRIISRDTFLTQPLLKSVKKI